MVLGCMWRFDFAFGLVLLFLGSGASLLNAANELCQVAKLHEAALPISSAMAINSRYSKSKTLLVRNSRQIRELRERFPKILSAVEKADNGNS